MILKPRALFTALLLFCGSSHAAEWVLASKIENDLQVYLDIQSLRRSGAQVKAWELWTFDFPQGTTGATYRSLKTLQIYDCSARTNVMLQEVRYAEQDGGDVVKSISNREKVALAHMSEVTPGSVAEDLLLEVCERTRPKASNRSQS